MRRVWPRIHASGAAVAEEKKAVEGVDVLHLQLTGNALPSTDRTVMEEGRAGFRLKKRKHMQRN